MKNIIIIDIIADVQMMSSSSRALPFGKKKKKKKNGTTTSTTTSSVVEKEDVLVSSFRLFAILLAFRASSAVHNLVHDCDETFQSLEPVHFLLCDVGTQSWELSGKYALRSYAYVVLHAWIGLVPRGAFGCEGRGTVVAFYAMRFALAIFSARGDAFLTRECLKIEPKVGATVLLVATFGTGNYVASTSMLPNSFAMGCVTRAVASSIKYLNFRATRERFGEVVVKEEMKKKKKEKVSDDEKEEEDDEVVIEETLVIKSRAMERACMWCVIGVLIGWPFAGIACVPIGALSVWMVGVTRTTKAIVLPTIGLFVFTTLCDTFFYGGFSNGIFRTEWTNSVVNIVKYNVRGSGGSELYGTENWSFYLRNLALQFNVAFPLAVVAPVMALFSHAFQIILEAKTRKMNKGAMSKKAKVPWLALLFCALPFHVALVFFSLMPHKEERFLYIVYGPLAVSSGITVAAIFDTFKTFSRVIKRVTIGQFFKSSQRAFTVLAALIGVSSLMLFIALSASRTFALVTYYGAPIEIYGSLPEKPLEWLLDKKPSDDINVCVGDEWYRFPSHFHLPNKKYRIRFIRGAFNGSLPMYFESAAGKGTAGSPVGLNDKNQAHENQWFYPNASSPCDFLVETDETNDGQKYFKEKPNDYGWDIVRSLPFLDNSKSTDFLARTLYIPGYSEKHNVYTKYHLKVRTKNIATGERLY